MSLVRLQLLLVIVGGLSACNLQGVNTFPSHEIKPELTRSPTPIESPTISYEQCGYIWATQQLPELSSEVQSAMEASGLRNVSVRTEAYGENCLSQDNSILYFAPMETDFHIEVDVLTISDNALLGSILEQILIILDAFPPGGTPGTQPGYIGVLFRDETEVLNLWFSFTQSASARAQELHGVELLDALLDK